jgi:hypothetical protein
MRPVLTTISAGKSTNALFCLLLSKETRRRRFHVVSHQPVGTVSLTGPSGGGGPSTRWSGEGASVD